MGVNETRNIFLNGIYELMKQGEDIVVVSADLGAPSLDALRRDFPQRFINVGIAEQNLISVSCGLAMSGRKVIAYAASPFPALRSFDQIRNAVGLMKIPISIVTVGSGFNVTECGATHFCVEDLSLMRTCPNLKIISISDASLAEKSVPFALQTKQPIYFRFDRLVSGTFPDESHLDFNKGFRVTGRGNDLAIITNGYFTQLMAQNIDKLKSDMSVKIIDVYSMPFDGEQLLAELENVNRIVSVEEQVLQGGLGSAMLELFSDYGVNKQIKRFGLNFEYGFPNAYGSREYQLKTNGLDVSSIIDQINRFCI